MGYKYSERRHEVFLEQNQEMFLTIRDNIDKLLSNSGACTIEKAIQGATGDSWTMLACVDRLVELGEIKIINVNGFCQYNIITRR